VVAVARGARLVGVQLDDQLPRRFQLARVPRRHLEQGGIRLGCSATPMTGDDADLPDCAGIPGPEEATRRESSRCDSWLE
jgi:hypothetical protein